MAKDVITRFKLETTQYDSKIKNAAKELSDVAKSAKSAGADFERFTKDSLEAARSLGTIATSSVNAKDRAKELVGAFNDVARSYNQLTEEQKKSDFGKAVADSLTHLQQRIRETKEEMKGLEAGGGGLFSGIGSKMEGALAVFGGNVMTKVAGMATGLVTEMGDAIKQGVELARQGEGIRIAFERLGRGDILQGLREATHGTVTDLELMKAAVKFNDFKLPVEELGTMLAFAQQKAKDTGQSVDYMVDSIVTGLGRKSLMILDNLGLSATEIKERMKETGDMTKAVGAIIRDQMAKAGDYVETAADRAAQANVSLQNKMEELGRKFGPVEEASNQLWTSIKIGILDIVGGPLAELLNGLTEAGRLQNAINSMNGGGNGGPTRIDRMVSMLGDGKGTRSRNTYNKQLGVFDERINQQQFRIAALSGNDAVTRGLKQKAETELKALQAMRAEYVSRANDLFNAKPGTSTTPTGDKKEKEKKVLTELQQNQQKINDLTQEYVKLGDESTEAARERQAEIQKEIALLEKRNSLLGLRAEQAQGRLLLGAGDFQRDGLSNNPGTLLSTPNTSVSGLMLDDKAMKAVNKQLEAIGKSNIKQLAEVGKETEKSWRGAAGAMSAAGSALQGLEDPGAKIAGIVGQAIANIALGFSQATAASSGGGVFGWIAAIAGGLTTMLSTISAIHSATGYAQGGIVDGREGGFVGGMAYSGDNIGNVRLDSGELVLNRAQQNNLANALEGGNNTTVDNRQPYVNGELIYLGLNNYLKRTGRGEIVVSKR